ncbi:MAG: hypothetical protein WC813_03705 [Patescibacteria group bacterium]
MSPDLTAQDIANRVVDNGKAVAKNTLTTSIVTYLINLMTFAADKAAYEAAVRLGGAGPGGTPLVDQHPWKTFKKDWADATAGEAIGLLSDEINGPGGVLKNFNLCAPGSANVLLSFKFGIKSAFKPADVKPKCELNKVVSNWKGFIADVSTQISGGDARNQHILTKLADSFDPSTTEFSVGIALTSNVINSSYAEANLQAEQRLSNGDYKSVTDFISGQVTTPAKMIDTTTTNAFTAQKNIGKDALIGILANTDALLQVGIHAGSIFTNTLLSKLSERVYTGLFDVDPALQNTDPFDPSSFAQGNSDALRARFKAIFTATPLQISNYSILADFSSCPQTNRGLYNCVADSSFISAIARASSGVPMTVQEAMDDGLLKSDWPLIPSSDHARNQDPFCSTYGYCYSNLVKLRKARVLSVGWEFAADSEFNSANDPVTLRKVVAGFNDCDSAGRPNKDHPWCKLIDPNWVLKYPQTQCRASVNGQLLTSNASNERQDECVDMPSCIAEDENGNCTGGYGYCVREENVWQFRGQSCPKQFASCITVKNSEKTASYLRNTTDPGPCTADNAGCQWYVNNKTKDSTGTFSYPIISSVATADADANAFKNRTYYTGKVEKCEAENGGCKELVIRDKNLSLNMLVNPSLEANTDNNTLPDGWYFSPSTGPTWDTTGTLSRSGSNAIKTGAGIVYEPGVEFSQSRFYTMSFYARQTAAGSTDKGQLYIGFGVDDGSAVPPSVDLGGTSKSASANAISCDFKDGNNDGKMDAVVLTGQPTGTTYERFSCTFTSPIQANAAARIFAFVDLMPGQAWIDDVQVEQGPLATNFHDGYSSTTLAKEVVKVPPSYLGCTGAATDSVECAKYAKVCGENDNGCSAYTPANGDPAVTGVISELDFCPAICVGYDTYKQEATRYEPNGLFPLHFIPASAKTCTAQNAGCDEFTNLADESKAYFTYVRACVTPAQAEANTQDDKAATFYTWEGSDNAGYQLKTWTLLESNLGPTPRDYSNTSPVTTDTAPSDAPCTHWTSTVSGITCSDTYDWAADASCNSHADIFSNADCREFYDTNGIIHYRTWLDTVTVDAACANYRKTDIAGADELSRQSTCVASGGFFDISAGTCRYNGLTSESRTCPATANGCREYTGGRSRNSRVAYQDLIEDGNLTKWTSTVPASLVLSNESLATGGHSISTSAAFATTVSALQGQLFSGKTYTLSFLAKGSGNLAAGFDYQATSAPALDANFGTVALTSGWQQYSLGPLNMNDSRFGVGTALAFVPVGSVFVDNIVLREGQDKVMLIKNSWVTPAVCDKTPTGTAAPQYYLGCQAYSTQTGATVNVKSFSKLCAEDKVGCASFFMTQESESPHAEVHNATCGTLDGSVALTATACYYGTTGAVYNTATPLLCTIGTGFTSCPFNLSWYVAPVNLPAHLKYVPSTLVTPADKDVFLVVNDSVKCTDDAKGCTEYGKPNYNQTKTATTGAKSIFLKNDPAAYSTTLCTQNALFCSAWTGTGGTQYYFKDPGDRTCEYKTNVTVGTTSYDGWFKTGTTELCYNSPNYVIGGNQSGIWKNGDTAYAGWVGTCANQYNSCSEYQDPLAIGDNEIYANSDGTPYFTLSSSLGSARSSVTGTECNGKVSLKGGCALFNDTSVSAKNANSSATEMSSRHADALFNAQPFSLVDPIDCDSNATTITTPSGASVDLCAKRCVYAESAVKDLTAQASTLNIYGSSCYNSADCAPVNSEKGELVKATSCASGATVPRLKDDANTVLAVNRNRQCSEWLSCADAQTVWDERTNSYKTVCADIALCTEYSAQGSSSFCSKWNFEDPKVVLDNDRYTSRDVTWYGSEYSGMAIPNLFPVEALKQANVALPFTCDLTRLHDNRNISDEVFEANNAKPCSVDTECGVSPTYSAGLCSGPQVSNDFRLVLNAGVCGQSYGAACTVGTCENTGAACSTQDNCGNSGGACVVGRCYVPQPGKDCVTNSDCPGAGTVCISEVCSQRGDKVVTDSATSGQVVYRPPTRMKPELPCGLGQIFSASVGLKSGTCINKQCLLAPNGSPFEFGTTEGKSCRAYPETTSPFSSDIVETWLDTTDQTKVDTGETPTIDDLPYDTRSGFEHASFCAYGEDCLCSYKKVTYGEGGQSRYFSKNYVPNSIGVCATGTHKGAACENDAACSDDQTNNPGSCSKASREDVLLGMDGYCLERDGSINVNGDRDQNACITWLPVDQLAGSSDLYGKNVEAGFSQEANYCSSMKLYADVYTGEGCVEREASGSVQQRCINVGTTCPPGTYGVVGPFGDGNSTGQTKKCWDANNSCPYVCVPIGSRNADSGTSCSSSTIQGVAPMTRQTPKNRGGYTFELYWVETTENFDKIEAAVNNCVIKGREFQRFDVSSDASDGPRSFGKVASTFGLSVEGLVGTTDRKGWRAYQSRYQSYVACNQMAQVQDISTLGGAPWTDRLNNSAAAYALTVGSAWPNFAFTPSIKLRAFGATPVFSEMKSRGYPAIPAQCTKIGADGPPGVNGYVEPQGGTPGAFTCSPSDYTASDLTPDINKAEALAYTDLSANLSAPNGASTGVSISEWASQTAFSEVGVLAQGVKDLLSQIFAKSLGRITYSESYTTGTKNLVTQPITTINTAAKDEWDVRATQGHSPKIWAIDPTTCKGSECEEGPVDQITVNDQNTGDISSSDFLRASVKFYAAADKNQLPLRRVIMDWGDGENVSGSSSDDNFYKNHRGLQSGGDISLCDKNSEWGMTAESCDPNYITYSHIYTCSTETVLSAPACGTLDANGRNTVSPCVTGRGTAEASCVYQPRVHIRDNWGWCAGVCADTNTRNTTSIGASNGGCFGMSLGDASVTGSECAYLNYPFNNPAIDPWVYYDGQVIVKP